MIYFKGKQVHAVRTDLGRKRPLYVTNSLNLCFLHIFFNHEEHEEHEETVWLSGLFFGLFVSFVVTTYCHPPLI